MFWLAWRIEPLMEDPRERETLFVPDYWFPVKDVETRFFSCADGQRIDFIIGGQEELANERLVLRGPYPHDNAMFEEVADDDDSNSWLERWFG
jgi:hypothetical protein